MTIKAIRLNKIGHIERIFACGLTVENVADKVEELIAAVNMLLALEEERLNNTYTILKEQKP
jgi:hypothetical protein